MKRYDALIFDWDGTLLDSADHIAACMCEAFVDMNLNPPTIDEAKNIIGLGMIEAIQQLRPEMDMEMVRRVRERYSEHFFRKPMTREDLFEGVLEMLDEAATRGYQLAIATGKSRPGMDVALKALAMEGHFQVVRCADETRSKPHPLMLQEILRELSLAPERALMIGDTEYDMAMARNAGMDRLGVTYGVHSRDRLMLHEPIGCIDSITSLHGLV